MPTIPATKGQVILVDEEDYAKVCKYSWYAHNGPQSTTFYARARINGKRVFLHRYLTKAPRDKQVDHINGNGLDNRRCNLRLATYSQNQRNSRRQNRFGVKGVCKFRGHYASYIGVNGSTKYLGVFKTVEDAGRAYAKAAKELHGDFACLEVKA